MECYNFTCKEECYDIKEATCLFKVTKEQHLLKSKIYKQELCECGNILVDCKVNKKRAMLCTSCKRILSPTMLLNRKEGLGYEQLL